MKTDQITYEIIGAACVIHKELGPGLLESAYLMCLDTELRRRGLRVERQKLLPLQYDGIRTNYGYRVDLAVESKVVVEVKALSKIALVHEAQVQTYLKLLNYKVGLLINFNVRWLKTGIHRIINPHYLEHRPPLR